MITFRQKKFSIASDVAKGATIGGSIGNIAGNIYFRASKRNEVVKDNEGHARVNKDGKVIQYQVEENKPFPWFRRSTKEEIAAGSGKFKSEPVDMKSGMAILATTGAGVIVGAALGALVGAGKAISKKINQTATVNDRILADVLYYLKSYKEGKDFTRDPKIASDLKTKVCIVLSKVSGEQQILINTVSDKKLESITDDVLNMINKLPGNYSSVKNMSDKYNDITISSIPDKTTAKTIAGIAEKFIKAHYPVYFVEVG